MTPAAAPDLKQYNLTVVIPAYRVAGQIGAVLGSIPGYIRHIIVVNDASPDETAEVVRSAARSDARIRLIEHAANQGVGGAMITGFREALQLGAQVVVKVDGDGQMNPAHLPDLLGPLIAGSSDYTKGNRFRDFQALSRMPLLRRIGNTLMSFLAKAATGYWNSFDPTNGYLAIRGDILRQLQLERIDRTYFFETSLLGQLYLLNAAVRDIPMPARYGDETSSISIGRVLMEFPVKLVATLARRVALKYFVYDFSIASIYLALGIPLVLFGTIFGALKWIHFARLDIPAPTGTIMLAVLTIVIGFQILLSAAAIDLQAAPKEPINAGPLEPEG